MKKYLVITNNDRIEKYPLKIFKKKSQKIL
jgi:hypothetical protein